MNITGTLRLWALAAALWGSMLVAGPARADGPRDHERARAAFARLLADFAVPGALP